MLMFGANLLWRLFMTKAEKIANIPLEQIAKLSGEQGMKELRSYVSTLRNGYIRRVRSFERRGEVSYAQIALEKEAPPTKIQLTRMTRNQLILEFARYSAFFNSRTSTLSGIRKTNLEQDLRLFGRKSTGKPRRTLSSNERILFWSLYDEFLNQEPGANSRYGSESIQQQIAEALFVRSLDSDDKVSFLVKVASSLEQGKINENVGSVPNVYSGRGTVK